MTVSLKRAYVQTYFLSGFVIEEIDGSKKGWYPTTYYRVKVFKPKIARGTEHIIRIDEIIALPMSPFQRINK